MTHSVFMKKSQMKLTAGWHEYDTNIGPQRIHFRCRFDPDSREAVLFLHGLACSLESFRHAAEHDHFQGKSLLLMDLAGFGKSSKTEGFSYSMEGQAALIERLFSLLPPWEWHIAAHSMGGAIALLFSRETYSRVRSFANIEGNLIAEDCGILSRGIAALSLDEYRTGLFPAQQVEYRGHQQMRFEESIPLVVHRSATSLVHWSDSGELLAKFRALACKKSYFFGEESKNMPILGKLDFVRKYMIQSSGHGMMTENPGEFYAKLAEFINSNAWNPS